MATQDSGSRGVQVTVNTWSDEARQAAAQARKAKSGGEGEEGSGDHHVGLHSGFEKRKAIKDDLAKRGYNESRGSLQPQSEGHSQQIDVYTHPKHGSLVMTTRHGGDTYPDAVTEVKKGKDQPTKNTSTAPITGSVLRNEDDASGDPRYSAQKKLDLAQQEYDAAEKDVERRQLLEKANKLRADAQKRSEEAYKAKGGGPSVKKLHITAAMAHEDAAEAFKGLGGSKMGAELDARGKASSITEKHTAEAEKHRTIAEGVGYLKRNSSGQLVEAGTGRKGVRVTVNTWSPEARQAAAEARKEGAKNAGIASIHAHAATSKLPSNHRPTSSETALMAADKVQHDDAEGDHQHAARFHETMAARGRHKDLHLAAAKAHRAAAEAHGAVTAQQKQDHEDARTKY